ncbi:MAG: hypothetical protein KKF44_00740 [Nanoarchaeota archaeon]|nr:hypothetical protein [Nanoarchaeota archaeon]
MNDIKIVWSGDIFDPSLADFEVKCLLNPDSGNLEWTNPSPGLGLSASHEPATETPTLMGCNLCEFTDKPEFQSPIGTEQFTVVGAYSDGNLVTLNNLGNRVSSNQKCTEAGGFLVQIDDPNELEERYKDAIVWSGDVILDSNPIGEVLYCDTSFESSDGEFWGIMEDNCDICTMENPYGIDSFAILKTDNNRNYCHEKEYDSFNSENLVESQDPHDRITYTWWLKFNHYYACHIDRARNKLEWEEAYFSQEGIEIVIDS